MFSHIHKQYALQFSPRIARQFAGSEVANTEQYWTTELDKFRCLTSVNDGKWGKVDAPGHCHIMDQLVEDIVMVRLLNMH